MVTITTNFSNHFHQHQLDEKTTHVWCIDLNTSNQLYTENFIEELKYVLSANEVNKASKFYTQELQIKYIICRSVLKMILSNYINSTPNKIIFSYNKYGKPYLTDTTYKHHFNVSHSDNMALIAVSKQTVGIDIEKSIPFESMRACLNDIFTQEEIHFIKNDSHQPITNRFLDIWTRKESYIKGRGYGLSLPLKSFSVPTINKSGHVGQVIQTACTISNDNQVWEIYSFPNLKKKFRIALSLPYKANSIEFFNFKWDKQEV